MHPNPAGCVEHTAHTPQMQAFLTWLASLIQDNGPGEYVVIVRKDGSAVVKRPREPLKFEWGHNAE